MRMGVVFASKINCQKAYDSVEWPFLWWTMLASGTRIWAVACYLHEISLFTFTYVLQTVPPSRPTRRQRGLLQGCPLSPVLFNQVLQRVLVKCWKATSWCPV